MHSQYRDNSGHAYQGVNRAASPAHDPFHSTQNVPVGPRSPVSYGSPPQAPGDSGRYYDRPNDHGAGEGAGLGLGAAGAAAAGSTPFVRSHYGDRRGEYVDQDATQQWMNNGGHAQTTKKRSKWMIFGGIGLLVVIIIVAVVVGVVVSRNKSKNSSSSSSATVANAGSFAKDSRLKQSFYGIAYTPEGSQLPDCGNSLGEIIKDVQILSQLTTRIRLYGADCNQSALVLDAIDRTKVNLTVFLGNYPIATDNNAAYNRQRDTLKSALQSFGADHVGGVTVGNEFMLNYLNANGGGSDPNSAVGNQGAQLIIADIKDTQSMIESLNLGKTIPIGNADAGSYFNTEVLQAVNYGMANVHPWFANVSIDDAAGWTWDFFDTNNVQAAAALSNKPQMSIAETGWPTKSSDAGNQNNGPSTASEANLQKFMDTFVCAANKNGTEYFFFEFKDEPWKDKQFGGVEGWWGLFNSDRSFKNINFPDCSS